jgi:hypothetical protein
LVLGLLQSVAAAQGSAYAAVRKTHVANVFTCSLAIA